MSLSCADITAVILVGGKGTRLSGVINDRPKVLAPIGDRIFLHLLLDKLVDAGVQKVVLCSGYMAEKIEAAVGSSYRSLEICYSIEAEPLDTAGAIRLAAAQVDSDPFLVMNGDSFVDLNLTAYLQWFQTVETAAALLLTEVADTDRYGRVEQKQSGQIISFVEKGCSSNRGWINAGAYLFRRSVLELIPTTGPWSLERALLPELLKNGLSGYRCPGRFIDIGTPESYQEAEQFFATGKEAEMSAERGSS